MTSDWMTYGMMLEDVILDDTARVFFEIEKHTLWLFNIAMENGPFIDDFPIKTTIYGGFSMAMLVITRW